MRTVNRQPWIKRSPYTAILRYLQTVALRAALFALLWWILTDGAINSWPIGVPVVLLTALISVALLPSFSCSLLGFIQFVPFFLYHSLRGGVDVARRALHPQLPILPGMHQHQWRLPPGLSRVFMANTVSLLPGTLSAELDATHLRIHLLDNTSAYAEALQKLELRVAKLFALELTKINT
jgi:multicomponent Na+:H+ antiporter subunit E